MVPESLSSVFAVIFIAAAVIATLSLRLRLPILIAYIVVGILLGPYGLHWVPDTELLADIAEIGIMFLLFLLGLDMQPAKLAKLLGQTAIVGALSCAAIFVLGTACAFVFYPDWTEAFVVGAAMMFSSTIVGIKLLPTTLLHHRHRGELMVSILLFQDFIAMILMVVLNHAGGDFDVFGLWLTVAAIPVLVVACFLFVRYVLLPLIAYFDAFHEYMFLLAIGWCLGIAELSAWLGMSMEIGAFVAGVSLATSPVSQYIAESLKPIRDFFLVLFFFALGALFDLSLLSEIWLPALILTAIVVFAKPPLFSFLLRLVGEKRRESREVGWRLAQASEFSLLVAYVAASSGLIRSEASHIIQAVVILSFALSTFLVIRRYTSPMATDPRLRRN